MSTDFACVGCGVDLSTSGRPRATKLPVCGNEDCKRTKDRLRKGRRSHVACGGCGALVSSHGRSGATRFPACEKPDCIAQRNRLRHMVTRGKPALTRDCTICGDSFEARGVQKKAVRTACPKPACHHEIINMAKREYAARRLLKRGPLAPKVVAPKATKTPKPKAVKVVTPAMLVRMAKAAQPKVLPVAKLPREHRNDPRLGVLDGGKWTTSEECPRCHKSKPTLHLCFTCATGKPRELYCLRPDERVAA